MDELTNILKNFEMLKKIKNFEKSWKILKHWKKLGKFEKNEES